MGISASRRKSLPGNLKKTYSLLNMERRRLDWSAKDIYFSINTYRDAYTSFWQLQKWLKVSDLEYLSEHLILGGNSLPVV